MFTVAAAVIASLAAPAQAQDTGPRRAAVVIGANQASPGRRPLRFSHEDARRVAQVLTDVAGFAKNDVAVLLDPAPAAALAAVDAAIARVAGAGTEALIVFYYSGHADERALYPAGRALPVSELRQRFDDGRVKLRIGIIDACRGGGWTGAKGLSEAPPFEVDFPVVLSNEGSVLISSSSGIEDAHESEALQGSFFTHHWNAGLRGAADRDGDGHVTINEAFEYARGLTVRDTALVTREPQHPSFRLDLRGRADVTLTTVDSQRTILVLRQHTGPLQLVHLDSGLVVVETPAGARKARLAVRPGRYVVRRVDAAGTRAREVNVAAGAVTDVSETSLGDASPYLSVQKTADGPAMRSGIMRAGQGDLATAAGVRHVNVVDPGLRFVRGADNSALLFRFSVGLGRGFHVALPGALAWGTERGAWEMIAWGGVATLGATETRDSKILWAGRIGGGVDITRWLSRGALHASVNTLGAFAASRGTVPATTPGGDDWTVAATVAYSYSLAGVATLAVGGAVVRNLLVDGSLAFGGDVSAGTLVAFGSVQRRGLRPLPLIRVHLGPDVSLDGHVSVAYAPAEATTTETYLLGGTWLW